MRIGKVREPVPQTKVIKRNNDYILLIREPWKQP